MEIKAAWGLGKLKPKVKHDLEKVLHERRRLGLGVPENVEVRINYYNDDCNAAAKAFLEGDTPVVDVNVLNTQAASFSDAECDKGTEGIKLYFSLSREIFGDYDEEWILEAMKHPVNTIEAFEEELGPRKLARLKRDFNERGKKYSKSKFNAIKFAKPVRRMFRELKPKIDEKFLGIRVSDTELRHEVDHIDFMQSKIAKKLDALVEKEAKLRRLVKNGETKYVAELHKTQTALLRAGSEENVIAEIRALFFDQVPMNRWAGRDYERLEATVYEKFDEMYMNGPLTQEILETLIAMRITVPEFSKDTENYVRRMVHISTCQPEEAAKYRPDAGKINYPTAKEILRKELPFWQSEYEINAMIAAIAVSRALEEDSSRLKRADETAETFKDYILVLLDGDTSVLGHLKERIEPTQPKPL
ncbi:hypothetical protein KY311_04100 [Candidatus Woesearchaeota archaeon]|nr:hypothetical protein [Candidatus Woesearchaeota archaeon]